MNWSKFFRDLSLLVFILAAVGWGVCAITKNDSGFIDMFIILVVSGSAYLGIEQY